MPDIEPVKTLTLSVLDTGVYLQKAGLPLLMLYNFAQAERAAWRLLM